MFTKRSIGFAVRKLFQIFLSFAVLGLLSAYIFQSVTQTFFPSEFCYFKSEDSNYMLDMFFYLMMIVVLCVWGYFLYKSYFRPFTWKDFFLNLFLVFVFLTVIPYGLDILFSSDLYKQGETSCFE